MCSTHEVVQYSWGTPALPVRVCSTSEAHSQYLWETFNEWKIHKISSQVLEHPHWYCGVSHRYRTCFRKRTWAICHKLSLKKQLPAHFYGHAIIVRNILCFVSRRAWGSRTEAFISHLNAFFALITVPNFHW